MLKAQDIHKVFKKDAREVYAIKGISLEVRKNEILAIVGPSGAGKSTLLHLLGGLDEPTAGSVFLDDINLYRINDNIRSQIRNRRIGFVFQFYHLLPEFTALENVMLPGMIGKEWYKEGEIKDKAEALLEIVGLKERFGHKPPQLSGGESQRVAIARALINRPEIVFCDEPTGNLDSKMSDALCDLIWKLKRKEGQTFVIVTHEHSLARRADRILYIKDGMLT